MNSDETLEFDRDNDLYEALTYAVACSRSAHVGLHAFEVGAPFMTCAKAIWEIVEIVSFLLDDLNAMIDRVRREGQAWTSLTLDDKDRTLRQVFENAHRADDFRPVSSVWWEPLELYCELPEPPASGCPAWVALWEQLWPMRRSVMPGRTANGEAAVSNREVEYRELLRGAPSSPAPLSEPAVPNWDELMREITRLNQSDDPDANDGAR